MKITATWTPNGKEETKITFSGFEKEDGLSKMDFLDDVMNKLQKEYDKALIEWNAQVERYAHQSLDIVESSSTDLLNDTKYIKK